MTKIVINTCYGGFGLSKQAQVAYEARTGHEFDNYTHQRDDPNLVAVVEQLGLAAGDRCSELKIVEIPDDVRWQIEEYDGSEWIAEQHRTWS